MAFTPTVDLEEIEMLANYGLTPYQALETATRNPAEFLGELDEWGQSKLVIGPIWCCYAPIH